MAAQAAPAMANAAEWYALAQQLRVDSIRATTRAGSGHPTSALSAADLLAVLASAYLTYDWGRPHAPNNDHLISSKGHAAPLLYAVYKAMGAISDHELLTLRQFGSRLQGHPVPALPHVDVATGSLGQGLPIGVGIALAGQYLDKRPYRVWVLLGDGEMAEGSVWEALDHAAHYRLSNLTAIVDVNRLGQRGETELGWDLDAYATRVRAFGWHAVVINGHAYDEIAAAYAEAELNTDSPTCIIARTIKGKGVSFLENKENWHGKALSAEQTARAIEELGGERTLIVQGRQPACDPATSRPAPHDPPPPLSLPRYQVGDSIATRKAYGESLVALGKARSTVVGLDAEVSNSTYAEAFAHAFPQRYFEMYIAEQQLVGAAVGLQVRGYIPFASTFGAFFTRAYDFIRMAAISRAHVRLCGSHVGVSIGQDGPSQMALEDLAMLRAVPGSTVLYPSDANATAHLVATMADLEGISYLRTTRAETPVLYDADAAWPIGGSKVLRSSASDAVTVVAAGITVHEALKAHDRLRGEGVSIRVIDAYSVKPIDAEAMHQAAGASDRKLIVVEDHRPEGGLGDAVLDAFAGSDGPLPRVLKLAVREIPASGTPEELLAAAGIDADHIVSAVHQLVTSWSI